MIWPVRIDQRARNRLVALLDRVGDHSLDLPVAGVYGQSRLRAFTCPASSMDTVAWTLTARAGSGVSHYLQHGQRCIQPSERA